MEQSQFNPRKFIKKHLKGKRICWASLASNINITPKFLEKKITSLETFRYWDKLSCSGNVNFKAEFFEKYSEYHNCFGIPFENPDIFDEKFIERNAEEEWLWKWRSVLRNPVITIDILKKYNKLHMLHGNGSQTSYPLRLSLKDMDSNPDIKWNYNAIAMNCNIPLEELIAKFYLGDEHKHYSRVAVISKRFY